MSEQRSRFIHDFLRTHVNYTIADFKYDATNDTYSNPYIDHCYKLFPSEDKQCAIDVCPKGQETLHYYVIFNESVVQELERIHSAIDSFIEKMKELCKVFDAKGFYPNHSYKDGFNFESFAFPTVPDRTFWKRLNKGYIPIVPSLQKSLKVLLNSKFKPVTYERLFYGIEVQPKQVKELILGEGCVAVCLHSPVINYDVLVPTSREYFEYISSSFEN